MLSKIKFTGKEAAPSTDEDRVVVETPAVDGKLTDEDVGFEMIGKGEKDA
jgi:hypothetical protein